MATHSSILAWRIPWTEEPGGLQSTGVAKSQTRLSNFTLHFHFPFSRKRIFGGIELAEGNSDFLLQHPVRRSAHVNNFCRVVMGYLFFWSSISSQKYEQELFKLALPCLSAVAGALPPDYMESNYVSMMEKQSSMDSEGNFNPQPVDTSKYGLFLLQQIFIVNDV